MRINETKRKLRNGETSLGCWTTFGSPRVLRRLAADGGFDWLMIDTEHNPIGREATADCILAVAEAAGGRVAPLVRVPDLAVSNVKQALDAGAYGVLAPMINNAAEVAAFVNNCRYPPQGGRGVYGSPAAHLTFDTNLPDYFHGANEQVLVSAQIETLAALEEVERIAAVEGLDVLFVGPGDLHAALGLMPQNDSTEPAFLRALDKVLSACEKHGKTAGTLCMTVEAAHKRLAQGFRFVGIGNDASHLAAGARSMLAAVRPG